MMQREILLGKLRAATVHLLITLIVAALCALLVFKIWFPAPFYQMLGGAKLFLLVTISDFILGPLISLVIYTPKKTRSVLFRDYIVVAFIQASALVYGMHAITAARPIFIVFAVDGFEVVAAGDVTDEDLSKAPELQWRQRSWTGPQYVWAPMPEDPRERTELIFSALNGKDIQFLPKYYKSLNTGHDLIASKAKPVDQLMQKYPEQMPVIRDAISNTGRERGEILWLPVRYFESVWTVLVDKKSLLPKAWIDLDPY